MVLPLVKQPSYEAFYESLTQREYPFGNRHRMLDEDLKAQASGVLKMGSFTNLLSTGGGGSQRRITNLGNDAPPPNTPGTRTSFFSFRRGSRGATGNDVAASTVLSSAALGAEADTVQDPDDSDNEKKPPWSSFEPRTHGIHE